ncbi:MAG: hypothetical protein AAGI53_17625 [Planctomycetota bacterium]
MPLPDENTPIAFLTDDELRQSLTHAVLEVGEWLDDRGTFRGGRKADRVLFLAEELHRRVRSEIESKWPKGVPF